MTTPLDLNKILFAQLNDLRGAKDEDLKEEIKRAEAVSQIAERIIENNETIVDYTELAIKAGARVDQKEISMKFLGG